MLLFYAEMSDSDLESAFEKENKKFDYILTRGNGYFPNMYLLKGITKACLTPEIKILTNDETLLSLTDYWWNEQEALFNIYFYSLSKNDWIHINETTIKALRKPNALTRMYYAGAFDF